MKSLRFRILEQIELKEWTNTELAHRLNAHPASVSSITCKLAKQRVISRRRNYWSSNWRPWLYSARNGTLTVLDRSGNPI